MVAEVLEHLRPSPGDTIVDCTLGGGGHAEAILAAIAPGGRLVGLDVDPIELPRTEARLRAAGHGPDTFVATQANFRHLTQALASLGVHRVDGILADLGVSAMQHDTPARGFSYRYPGPLDLRLDPTRGTPASAHVAVMTRAQLADILLCYSDEPHADVIAGILTRVRPETTNALERHVRLGLMDAVPGMSRAVAKMSVRRTFQALRILVNDELPALDELLTAAPNLLAHGGRLVVLTFHPGEDVRVSDALANGRGKGVYADANEIAVRSRKAETWSNRRAASARLRWAVRAR